MHSCFRCGVVEGRRNIGVGTLLLVLITTGWWLLAIPFYKKRCPICKAQVVPITHAGGKTGF